MHGYMCYKFEPPEINYTLFSILHTLDHHRMLYEVAIGSPLNAGHKVSPLLHFGEYPFRDQFYSQEIIPPMDLNISFTVSYSSFQLHRLPPPYATRCKLQSESECFINCISKKLNQSSSAAFSSLVNGSTILNEFGLKHSVNKTTRVPCNKACERSCDILLVVTSVSVSSLHGKKLSLNVETINSPSILMKVHPQYEFIEFFTQVTSLACCWVGFSVLGTFESNPEREALKKVSKAFISKLLILSNETGRILCHVKRLRKRTSETRSQIRCPKRKKSLRVMSLLSSLLFKSFVLISFLLQAVNVLDFYFKYSTTTVISFQFDPKINAPNADICLYYTLVIPTPPHAALTVHNYMQVFSHNDRYHNESLGELLAKAFPSDEIYIACRLRELSPNHLWNLALQPKSVCRKRFKIARYFMGRKICYHFEPRVKRTSLQSQRKQLLHVPGFFYTLILSPKISDKDYITFSVNYDAPPNVSMEFSHTDYRSGRKKLLILTTYVQEQHLKPFPYDTNCDPGLRSQSCSKECFMRETISKLNRLPYSEAYTEEFASENKLPLLKLTNLMNKTIHSIFTDIEDRCNSSCTRPKCSKKSAKTIVLYRYRSHFEAELGIDSKSLPDTTAHSVPLIHLFDLYFQLICCANFWLGFSMVHINPIYLMNQRKLKNLDSLLQKNFSFIRSALAFVESACSPLTSRPQRNYLFRPARRVKCLLVRQLKGEKQMVKVTFRLVCVICCSTHLYSYLSKYLEYLTIMNTYSETELNPTFYSLTVCISLVEKVPLFSINGTKDISQFTIDELLQKSPNISDSFVGCGTRGLQNWGTKSELTNRIFFKVENVSYCRSVFDISKYINNGFICYVLSQKDPLKMSKIRANNVFNYYKGIVSVKLKATFLTNKFMVIASRHQLFPYYSSFWSPNVAKTIVPAFYEVSYAGYNVQTLPAPYTRDGFHQHDFIECLHYCMRVNLYPLGKMFFGLSFKVGDAKYFSLSERQNVTIQQHLNNLRFKCKRKCHAPPATSFNSKKSLTVTKVSRATPGALGMQQNVIEFYLTSTEYPVISVIFLKYFTFIELIIGLASIVGIWFGCSALHLESVFGNSAHLKVQNLLLLEFKCKRIQQSIARVNYVGFRQINQRN